MQDILVGTFIIKKQHILLLEVRNKETIYNPTDSFADSKTIGITQQMIELFSQMKRNATYDETEIELHEKKWLICEDNFCRECNRGRHHAIFLVIFSVQRNREELMITLHYSWLKYMNFLFAFKKVTIDVIL